MPPLKVTWALWTLLALLAGIIAGLSLKGKYYTRNVTKDEFLRECATTTRIPIIVKSEVLHNFPDSEWRLGKPLTRITDAQLFVPDKHAAFFYSQKEKDGGYFQGTITKTTTLFGRDDNAGDVELEAEGTILRFIDGKSHVIISGITLRLALSTTTSITRLSSYVTYFSVPADLYVKFLLMLFVPTLAFSLVRAIVDNANKPDLLRFTLAHFVPMTILGSALGLLLAIGAWHCGLISLKPADVASLASMPLGEEAANVQLLHDPHPFLTQLSRIVPTNPLAPLTDANNNTGIQVVFVSVLLGVVLAFLSDEQRHLLSDHLRSILALIVKDSHLRWKALSDYGEFITPIGIFFVSAVLFATLSIPTLGDLGGLMLLVCGALVLHVVAVTLWLQRFRDYRGWWRKGFRPALHGLLTALATASSYAALPVIATAPLFNGDSRKRGILDVGTALNKCGTAAYLAAAAGYIIMAAQQDTIGFGAALWIILAATIGAIGTAGLPFAAIFSLRMTLIAAGHPGNLAWIIFSIDPLIDRPVTVVNAFSNLAACSDPKKSHASIRMDAEELIGQEAAHA